MITQRKRVARRLASGLLAGAMAFGGLAISGASPAGATPIGSGTDGERLSGSDRFATAVAVADYIDDDAEVNTVIVANGRNFPDALAASSLIYAYEDAVLLLVESNSIPAVTENMMNRLDDSTNDVIVVGGESAVSAEVFDDVESIFSNSDVVRVSGENRYDTSAEIAAESGWAGPVVLLTSGESFADAVTVGGYSATTGSPILLANGSGLPDATSDALAEALDEGIERVVIIGGTSAVWSGTEEALIELGFDPWGISRIAGADRYATNLNFNLEQAANGLLGINKYMDLADETLEQAGERMVLVTGSDFPDALAAASVAAWEDAHVILVNPTTVGASALTLAGASGTGLTHDSATDQYVSTALWQDDPNQNFIGEEVWVVGGFSAVPESVITTLETAATANLGCTVLAPGSNDSGDGSQVVIVAFAGNLGDSAGLGDSEYDLLSSDNSYMEINGNDNFVWVDWADFGNDGWADAMVYVNTGDALEVGDEIEFLGIEQDGDVWQDGDAYGLRNVGPCSTTVKEDESGPDAEWWGVDGDSEFFVHFSEPMADDYSDSIEDDLSTDNGNIDGIECETVDAGTYQDYSCQTTDAGAPEGLGSAATLDLDSDPTDYLDAAGNPAEFDDFDADVLADYPDVSVESVAVTCQTVGAGDVKANQWGNNFGTTPDYTNDGLITIEDGGGAVAWLAGPGVGGLTANDWSISITHKRGLLLPTIAVDGTAATITIDRYVHNSDDVIRVWNNSEWGRGGLAPKWIAIDNFASGSLFDVAVLDEAYTTSDHDSDVSFFLSLGGKYYGVANRACYFSAKLDAPLLEGVTAVTTNPDDEGEFRITFGNAAQDLDIQFADDALSGTTVEGIINYTEEAVSGLRATLFASGSRSSVDG